MYRPIVVLTLVALVAADAAAQAPRSRSLSTPDAEFAEPFTSITSVRELGDGRVLVTDRMDRALKLLDFRAKTVTNISRTGAGPTEFGLPGKLHPLRADTTLLNDGENLRYLVIGPDAKPIQTFSLGTGDQRVVGMANTVTNSGAFFFVDSKYATDGGPMAGEVGQLLSRRRRTDARVDTLVTLAVPAGRQTGARTAGAGLLFFYNSRPFAVEDAVAVAQDDWIAVVRGADYHVEWIQPNGQVIKGQPVAYSPIPVNDAEKKAFAAAQTRPGQITVFRPGGGAGTTQPNGSAGRARGGAVALPPGYDPFAQTNVVWPATKGAFTANAASIAPDGRLWVLRARAHDDPVPSYDIFDRRAQLVERVLLPKGARLAGFGSNAVYLVRTDADDLQYLQRFR